MLKLSQNCTWVRTAACNRGPGAWPALVVGVAGMFPTCTNSVHTRKKRGADKESEESAISGDFAISDVLSE